MEHNLDLIANKIQRFTGEHSSESIKNNSIDLRLKSASYQVTRLNDQQYVKLRKNSLSIAQDYSFLMYLSSNKNLIYHSFSRMYAALKSLFSESGNCYDDWKGSFSFPFLICFDKGSQTFDYLMNVHNLRSGIEFSLRKLVKFDNTNYDKMLIHKPFPDFTKEQMNVFLICFVGHLTDFFEANLHGNYDSFFYKTAHSNLIIFGHQNGAFFDYQFDEPDKFEAKLEELKQVKQ